MLQTNLTKNSIPCHSDTRRITRVLDVLNIRYEQNDPFAAYGTFRGKFQSKSTKRKYLFITNMTLQLYI